MIALILKQKVDSNDLSNFLLEFFKTDNHQHEYERHNIVPKMQADAQEFLNYVLQNIRQKTTINFSLTFNIKLVETIEKSCKKHILINVLDENMLSLKINSLSTHKLININDLLKNYFQKEQIECDCKTCKTQIAEKYSALRATPQNLILVLNIFKFENHVSKKITTFVELTNEINMSAYNEGQSDKSIQHFKLIGVCYHLGNDINSGHYTSELLI